MEQVAGLKKSPDLKLKKPKSKVQNVLKPNLFRFMVRCVCVCV